MYHSVIVSKAKIMAAVIVCASMAICFVVAEQAKAAPQVTSMPVERTFNQTALEDGARITIARFDLGRTSSNPNGTPISQWTAQDFFKFSDSEISLTRSMFGDERYDLIDQIKPKSMNRVQFGRAILRESARRGILANPYERRFGGIPTNAVTVIRPLGVLPEAQDRVAAAPLRLTLHNNATVIIKNPRIAGIQIEPDVAHAMGRPDLALHGVSIANDAATFDFGYTVGAMPEFRRGQTLELSLGFAQTPEVLQTAFCLIVGEIFRQPGRTLDQTEAFSAGFVQARMDARSNFQGSDIPVGLSASCPSTASRATTQDRLNFGLAR
jgi:hypothetical protein